MMRKSIQWLAALVSILMMFSVCAVAEESWRVVPEGETIEITLWTEWDPGKGITMSSLNDIKTLPIIEADTGVKLNFLHPTQGAGREQLNLMLVSGDLPDIIFYDWKNFPGGPMKVIDDGSVIPLNDLVDQFAPNYKSFIEANPTIAAQTITDEGVIYAFSNFCIDARDPSEPGYIPAFQTFGWLIRQDWLEACGINKLPETIPEWEAALTAFKAMEPQGEEPVIPFVANKAGDVRNWSRAWGFPLDFYIEDVENQKVGYGYYREEYRDALEVLARWYADGLIDPDFAVSDGTQKDALITGNIAGSWTGSTSGGFGRYITMMKPNNPDLKMTGTVPPCVEGGEPYKFDGWSKFAMGRQAVITTSCKNPEAAAKFADYFYGPVGHMLMNYGIEGVTYEFVDGVPLFTEYVTKNPDGLSIDQVLYQYALSADDFLFLMEPQLWLNRMSLPEQREMLPRWATGSKDRIMPPVLPTSDEAAEMSAVLGEITTYVEEMFTKFVMGVEPLSNFDTYIKSLESLGIERVLELKQAQLERYYQRIK